MPAKCPKHGRVVGVNGAADVDIATADIIIVSGALSCPSGSGLGARRQAGKPVVGGRSTLAGVQAAEADIGRIPEALAVPGGVVERLVEQLPFESFHADKSDA